MSEGFVSANGKKYAQGNTVLYSFSATVDITGLGFRPKNITMQCFNLGSDYWAAKRIICAIHNEKEAQYRYTATDNDYADPKSFAVDIFTVNDDGFIINQNPPHYLPWNTTYGTQICWTAESD